MTIHDYNPNKEVLKDRYASEESSISSSPAGRFILIPGFSYDGEPSRFPSLVELPIKRVTGKVGDIAERIVTKILQRDMKQSYLHCSNLLLFKDFATPN